MSHEKVIEMLEEIEDDIPFAYDHYAEGESPDPPFICFFYPESDNFGADNRVYYKVRELDIELYTDRKDPELEERVEKLLERHELFWEKSETWIDSEKMYEVLYTMEV